MVGEQRQGRCEVAALGALDDLLPKSFADVGPNHDAGEPQVIEQARDALALAPLAIADRVDVVALQEEAGVDLPGGGETPRRVDAVETTGKARNSARPDRRGVIGHIDFDGNWLIALRPPPCAR